MVPGKHVRFASQDIVNELPPRSPGEVASLQEEAISRSQWDDEVPLKLFSEEEPKPKHCSFVVHRVYQDWEIVIDGDNEDNNAAKEDDESTLAAIPYRSFPRSPILSPLPLFSPELNKLIEDTARYAKIRKDEIGQWWMESRDYHRLLKVSHRNAVLRKVKSRVMGGSERLFANKLMKELTPVLEEWASKGDLEHERWMAARFPEPVPDTVDHVKAKRGEFAKLRAELEGYGCPPCYSSDICYPFPGEEPPLVEALGGFEDCLYRQKRLWEFFSESISQQRKMRGLADYSEWVKKVRTECNLKGKYNLKENLDDQDALTKWVEYQTAEEDDFRGTKPLYEMRRFEFVAGTFYTLEKDRPRYAPRDKSKDILREFHNLVSRMNECYEYLPWIEKHRVELELEAQKTEMQATQQDSVTLTDNGSDGTAELQDQRASITKKIEGDTETNAAEDGKNQGTATQQTTGKTTQTIKTTSKSDAAPDRGSADLSSPLSSLSSPTPTPPNDLQRMDSTPQETKDGSDSPLSSLSTISDTPPTNSSIEEQSSSAQVHASRSRAGRVLKQPERYSPEQFTDSTGTKVAKSKKRKRPQTKARENPRKSLKGGSARAAKKSMTVPKLAGKAIPVLYKTARGRNVMAPKRWPDPC